MAEIKFDVAIVGGGAAGSAAAILLARLGHSVAMIEKSKYDQTRIGETLPPAARVPMEQMGVWERFLCDEHAPSPANISAWGASEISESHFIFNPYGNGWHIDRVRFDAMLANAAEDAGALVWRGARVEAVTCDKSAEWQVEIEGLSEISARFLIDASGRAGFVSRQMGAKRTEVDRLIGLVAFFQDGAHHDNRTLVESRESGWWYSALLPDETQIVAYMTDADLLPDQVEVVQYWQDRLQGTVFTHERSLHSRITPHPGGEWEFRTFSASSYISRPVADKNWLAVGDAAFAFDPLSSQGVYHAFESGIRAAEAIAGVFGSDVDALQAYADWAEKRFSAYLAKRKRYYNLEKRWVDSKFWRRRIS